MSLRGRRVLVTGGTGFLGGRLVEKLVLEQGAEVRVLVRDVSRASRIARFDLELARGDVTDAEAVGRAVRGCDVAVHCAYGNRGTARQRSAVDVDGTRTVAEAVLREGAARMVHVSSIAVYGRTPDGAVDETTSPGGAGDRYSRTKREGEALVLDLHRRAGLPVAVLRPTCVYGPFGLAFTIDPLEELASRRVVLVDGGEGLANVVYVDDAVDALLLAATAPAAAGEVFLVSGPRPVTWRELYAAYERMLGVSATVAMTAEEVRALARAERRRRGRREGLRAQPFDVPSEHMLAFYAARTVFRIDKAAALLGYRPRFDLERGMALTEAWARWAGLVPEPGR